MSQWHVVLVHGAYHRAWHLKFLKAKLEESGYKASTLDLPSSGPDPDKLPRENALQADIDAIKDVLEAAASESENIILLTHSYGGIPGGEAACEASEATRKKIKHIIYLAAFVIPQGTAGLTKASGKVAPWAKRQDFWAYVPEPIEPFYHDVEPELAQEAAKHVVPNSFDAFMGVTKHTPWLHFQVTYVVCGDDRAPPAHISKTHMFDDMPEDEKKRWSFVTFEGASHSPFLSRPNECAQLIRRIAGEDI